ncbi:MAG TPA: carbohydrate kinase family protein [Bacillota bacterium]|nr:carbohydrate kinase family protein [Bacillota bacterium]
MKKIAVIGTIFVDVKGMSFGPVHKDAKNVGKSTFSHGGVCRNVAQNLSVLGLDTSFITTVNSDGFGKEVIAELEKHQVNTKYARWYDQDGMGIWVAILDHTGDLVCSVSHQPNLNLLEHVVFDQIKEIAQEHDAIALDLDLTYPLTQKVIQTCLEKKIPLYGIVGNLDIVSKHRELLKDLNCFVCSEEEASILLGTTVDTIEEGKKAAEQLAMNGAPLTIVTLGSKGSVYFDRNLGKSGFVPTQKVQVVDTTGAGDAFFSGLVASLIQGQPVEEALANGTHAALQVIQTSENSLSSVKTELAEALIR